MRLACIDVGSNTTRLLVADAVEGQISELRNERAFTLIGRSITGGQIPEEKLGETAQVVAEQARLARELGCERIRAVATAAIRRASNATDLCGAVNAEAGIQLEVLGGDEEARLAFRGACRAAPGEGMLAVVDVGGGSTEIAVGESGGVIAEALSVPMGSSVLAEQHMPSDPPSPDEVVSARAYVASAFEALKPQPVDRVVAVGGSASSLQRLAGSELGPAQMEHAIEVLLSQPSFGLAQEFDLAPERVRLMPAGLVILAHLSRRFEKPLRICKGGLREGVIMEMMGSPD